MSQCLLLGFLASLFPSKPSLCSLPPLSSLSLFPSTPPDALCFALSKTLCILASSPHCSLGWERRALEELKLSVNCICFANNLSLSFFISLSLSLFICVHLCLSQPPIYLSVYCYLLSSLCLSFTFCLLSLSLSSFLSPDCTGSR